MGLVAGFQMDPIAGIDITGDSTFALALAGQARGARLFYYVPEALTLRDGVVRARGHWLQVRDEVGDHFALSEPLELELASLDVLFLRQDPPFDMGYVTTTHLLQRLTPKTLVVNDPAHVRNVPEKLFVLDFPTLTPPTLVTRSLAAVKAFRAEHGDIVVKPLYGNGGAGVFALREGDTNLGALVELFQQSFREPFIVQRYLPEIRAGDKRIILVDGEPVGAINRVPAADETRANMHVGARPEPATLTPRDEEICAIIGPELRRRGLIFAGIDVIGDWLTEINVTSPTGIREIARFGGADVAARIWDVVEARCRAMA